jgi:branched-subunit amino acid transport protein
MNIWLAVLALAAVCISMRITAPLVLGEHRPARLQRALSNAVPALLAALIVTGAVVDDHKLTIDPRLAGVTVAAAIAAARGPLLAAVLTAIVVTAVLRAVL